MRFRINTQISLSLRNLRNGCSVNNIRALWKWWDSMESRPISDYFCSGRPYQKSPKQGRRFTGLHSNPVFHKQMSNALIKC